jgi:hypothetical protein
LCDVLGDIDLESLFDVEMMEEYIMAIQNLKLGFDESTGLITANGKAMNTLQDVMMSFAQAKLAQTAASLRADKEALQSQIWTIEAEIEANQGLIDYLNSITDETVSLDQIKEAQINKHKILDDLELLNKYEERLNYHVNIDLLYTSLFIEL